MSGPVHRHSGDTCPPERALRRLVAALTAGHAAERHIRPSQPLPRAVEREVTAAYNEALDVIEVLDVAEDAAQLILDEAFAVKSGGAS